MSIMEVQVSDVFEVINPELLIASTYLTPRSFTRGHISKACYIPTPDQY